MKNSMTKEPKAYLKKIQEQKAEKYKTTNPSETEESEFLVRALCSASMWVMERMDQTPVQAVTRPKI